PYTAGQLATLSNAGIIDMATNGSVANDALTVDGNYVGSGGELLLQTTLGDDRSASDRLVVSQGTISGNTQLAVTEPARPIPVAADEPPVEPPTAVPEVVPVAPPTPIAPSATPADASPIPAPSASPIPDISPGAEPIPLYRLEVPIYSVFIPAAQIMAREAVGTFHDRQGDQSLLSETGTAPAGWARLYGSDPIPSRGQARHRRPRAQPFPGVRLPDGDLRALGYRTAGASDPPTHR
nr:hypothetical protein [Tanacetum cinerariifolium]